MALTAEQQAEIEFEKAREQARADTRVVEQSKMQKLEALRIAQNVVLENSRNSTTATPITAADLTSIGAALIAFIDS
jgi:hypothetical protein